MHKGLYPKSNVGRVNLPSKKGGRGLILAEDTVMTATLGLDFYDKDKVMKE